MSRFPCPIALPGFAIESVHPTATRMIIAARSTTRAAACPHCHTVSSSIHGHYRRAPRDLPLSTQPVRLHLTVVRFRCSATQCPTKTFAERFPPFLPPHAQRTDRYTDSLTSIAFALGGEAGARLSSQLRCPTSPATLLRLIRRTELPASATPVVLGLDDFAFRKRQSYGSLLVDLERRQPIDLLPDRTAATVTAWLQAHPGIRKIARDRSQEYSRGITDGAPAAVQIADRWHLLNNLREAVERTINRLRRELSMPPPGMGRQFPAVSPPRQGPLRPPSAQERETRAVQRAERMRRYEEVRRLYQQGTPLLQISRRMGLSRGTVRKFAYAPTFPERAVRKQHATTLAPYGAYLAQRWREGCQNARQLWDEVRDQGYGGPYIQVARWIHPYRHAPAASGPRPKEAAMLPEAEHRFAALPTSAHLAWLLVQQPEKVPARHQGLLAHLVAHPVIVVVYRLAQQFQSCIRQRTPDVLESWLQECAGSGIVDLETFAAGLQREFPSIYAAIAEAWSSGQTEGQINRLKLIKRQMYGRGKFDLLRKRVLYRAVA